MPLVVRFLVTPGFVTDVIGFSCLLPWTRQAFAKGLLGRFTVVASQHHQQGNAQFYDADAFQQRTHRSTDRPISGDVIDGEYERKD